MKNLLFIVFFFILTKQETEYTYEKYINLFGLKNKTYKFFPVLFMTRQRKICLFLYIHFFMIQNKIIVMINIVS